MKLNDQLGALRSAGIIRMYGHGQEPEYVFRHALVQEAAYQSLLKQDRKRLHLEVAQALEKMYPEQLDELSPLLAHHFEEAAEDNRALVYFIFAGERAMRQYALPEAAAHFTSALALAPRTDAPLAKLYRARGLAFESLGEFDRARTDHEAALQAARAAQDRHAEWQALLDLGMLWAGRDYARTGQYYIETFELARTLDDPAALAYSLNRMGNWNVNVEQPLEARRYHQQALALFQQLEDRHGIAETLDYLGMANYLNGNLVQGTAYYEQAIKLIREMDERERLASSLSTMTLAAATYQTTTTVLGVANLADAGRSGREALEIAREIGLRSAEAFALTTLSTHEGSRGNFSEALNSAQRAFAISEEIGHHQWMTFARVALGAIHADLFALAAARQHLEQALVLAKQIGSLHWIRMASGFLASVSILQNDLANAEMVIDAAFNADVPQTLGQRLVVCSRAELALARGDPQRALEIIAQLITSAANAKPDGSNLLRVSMLRGQALGALGQFAEAETALLAARAIADAQGARPMLWRIHAALGRLYRSEGDTRKSTDAFSIARSIINELASKIDDESLRKGFEQAAMESF